MQQAMQLAPRLLNAEVMHRRFTPKVNHFRYKVFYVGLPLKLLGTPIEGLKQNKFGFLSFYNKDHGHRDGAELTQWTTEVLATAQLDKVIQNITLVAMPRVLGMVFNPVSFWMCYDAEQKLRAVICEVNNTFGETHTYLCTAEDNRPLTKNDWIVADKVFHVSPFMEREGTYKFRFAETDKMLSVEIDHYAPDGTKLLATSLIGRYEILTAKKAQKAFFKCPLLAAKVVGLIHYQAFKLVLKGIKYVPKPKQMAARLTSSK